MESFVCSTVSNPQAGGRPFSHKRKRAHRELLQVSNPQAGGRPFSLIEVFNEEELGLLFQTLKRAGGHLACCAYNVA
jgi:hypothetical protein